MKQTVWKPPNPDILHSLWEVNATEIILKLYLHRILHIFALYQLPISKNQGRSCFNQEQTGKILPEIP